MNTSHPSEHLPAASTLVIEVPEVTVHQLNLSHLPISVSVVAIGMLSAPRYTTMYPYWYPGCEVDGSCFEIQIGLSSAGLIAFDPRMTNVYTLICCEFRMKELG